MTWYVYVPWVAKWNFLQARVFGLWVDTPLIAIDILRTSHSCIQKHIHKCLLCSLLQYYEMFFSGLDIAEQKCSD